VIGLVPLKEIAFAPGALISAAEATAAKRAKNMRALVVMVEEIGRAAGSD
jgi:hypothetical protein